MDEIPYPGDDEFYELLFRVASEFGKVFIVFDGADSVTASALRDLMLSITPNGSDPIFRVLFSATTSTVKFSGPTTRSEVSQHPCDTYRRPRSPKVLAHHPLLSENACTRTDICGTPPGCSALV
jgi:hypothetical protein